MPEGVKITVSTVQETREKDLITAEEIDEEMRVRCVGLGETGIWVHLRVTGKAAAEAMRFGFLKIDKAVDDTGENLALGRAPSLVGNYDDTTIDATKARVKDGFVMTVELSPAARKAAKIAALAGAFTMLCGGKQQEIVIQDVRSLVGKELQEPQLVKAGVKITPLKPDATAPEDADKKVGYALSGNTAVVVRIEFTDASGKAVEGSGAESITRDRGVLTRHIWLKEKLPEKAALRVTVLVGAKEVRVPIDLKDIPLP
jgi:hypothetical protein